MAQQVLFGALPWDVCAGIPVRNRAYLYARFGFQGAIGEISKWPLPALLAARPVRKLLAAIGSFITTGAFYEQGRWAGHFTHVPQPLEVPRNKYPCQTLMPLFSGSSSLRTPVQRESARGQN